MDLYFTFGPENGMFRFPLHDGFHCMAIELEDSFVSQMFLWPLLFRFSSTQRDEKNAVQLALCIVENARAQVIIKAIWPADTAFELVVRAASSLSTPCNLPAFINPFPTFRHYYQAGPVNTTQHEQHYARLNG